LRINLLDGKNTEEAVSDFARETNADILAVSTRRRNLLERLVSPSVTRKFAYHTHIPLLAFHADPEDAPTF
jgi:nucleotide-binding universal stress UspA family protein